MPFLWLYFGARYGGVTLPTLANTAAPLSGFLGESKSDGFILLGPKGRKRLAPYVTFRASPSGNARDNEFRVCAAMREAHLEFPLVAKPDIGQNGAGVKIVRNRDALLQWLSDFPCGEKVILQKYIEQEGEAGVFYIRKPDAPRGQIVSLTLKMLPTVTGDGISSLRELIRADPRARRIAKLYYERHKSRLDEIVPAGERVRLVSVGNHCKGAIFRNGAAHITTEMEAAFDTIAREIPGFFFGRFDVKYPSIRDLEQGKNFTILEINGADAEMTHIWDRDETIGGAYKALFAQYRAAFELGAHHRARGARPAGVGRFLAEWLRNRARLKSYAREE